MPLKRKAQEAFGPARAPISAFAAARLARETKSGQTPSERIDDEDASVFGQSALQDEATVDTWSSLSAEEFADDSRLVADSRAANVIFSTCRRDAVSTDESNDIRVDLNQDESLVCVGIFELRVKQGLATVYGVTLSPKQDAVRISAPSTHALPRIIARSPATVIGMTHVRSSLRNLERLSPLFRNLWTADEPGSHRSFTLLFSAADDNLKRSLVPMELDKPTEVALGDAAHQAKMMSHPISIMAVGAKSSGKSTFNRLLCNMITSKPQSKKVWYLDIDPGQPEFGPPGLVSLVEISAPILGPSFTHTVSGSSQGHCIIRAHALASTTFKDDPAHYIACVRDLLRYVDRTYPLVVNLAGWVSGLGADVLVELALLFHLSHVILFEPLDPELAQALESALPSGSVHRLQRQPARPSPRTPAQLRSLQTLAYFHSRVNSTHGTLRWSTTSLPTVRPWIVSYDTPAVGVAAVLSYGQSPSEKFLAEVLEGSIVALAICDHGPTTKALGLQNDEEFHDESEIFQSNLRHSPEGLPYLLDDKIICSLPLKPELSNCFGLALVRAIDGERKEIHLVTPLSERELASIMKQPVFLIRGGFDTPDWAYLEDIYSGDSQDIKERPWVTRKEPVGVEGAVWRLRHPPMAVDVS